MLLKHVSVKEGLKVYFLTINLRVDIFHEVVTELVTCLRGHKHYKQMLLCVEKGNATGPCTHHVHAIVHFQVNLQLLLSYWKSTRNTKRG